MHRSLIRSVSLSETIPYSPGGKGAVSLSTDCRFDSGMHPLAAVGFERAILFVGELRDCGSGELGGGVFFLLGGSRF